MYRYVLMNGSNRSKTNYAYYICCIYNFFNCTETWRGQRYVEWTPPSRSWAKTWTWSNGTGNIKTQHYSVEFWVTSIRCSREWTRMCFHAWCQIFCSKVMALFSNNLRIFLLSKKYINTTIKHLSMFFMIK